MAKNPTSDRGHERPISASDCDLQPGLDIAGKPCLYARLGIGYGRAFRDVLDGGPRSGSEYRHLLAAATLLRNAARVDPNRIGLCGGSYGVLMGRRTG